MPKRPHGRGTVYEDKARGRWVAQLMAEGKRRRRITATQREALAALDELIRLNEMGVSDARTTLEQYLAEYLEATEVAPSTLREYRSKVRLYITGQPIGKVSLGKLQPQHVRALFVELSGRGLAPATIRQVRAIISVALSQAVADGLITRNVASLVRPPRLEQQEARPLFPAEAYQFLESLRGDRLEPLYATALMLGLRQGELLGLRWADVLITGHINSGNGQITVRQSLQRIDGKYITKEPKTARARRTLPLPATLARLLEARRTTQLAEYMATGARPAHDLVFTTQAGNPISGSWLTHDLYRRLAAVGLPRVRFHDLRHSAASLLVAEGFGPREVMQVLGHSTIAMSMNTYAHIEDEALREKMGRVDEWRGR